MARTAKGTGQDNRQRILDTAMALIGEKGVERITLAQIAKVSGLSKGTLYYYYASKNDLIFDLADQHMARLTATLFEMIDTQRAFTLEALLTAFFSTLLASEARSRLHLYLVKEAVSDNPALRQRFQVTYDRWFAMVDQVYGRLGLPREGVSDQARFLVAVADGFILQTLLETGTPPAERIAALMRRVIG